jgi:hypothetical protein
MAVRRYLNLDGSVKSLEIRRGKRTFDVTFDFTEDPGEVEERARKARRRAEIGPEVFEQIAKAHEADDRRYRDPAPCTDVIEAARARRAAAGKATAASD